MQHHAAGLARLVKDDALVQALQTDYRRARLTAKDRAMLDYVYELTLRPWDMDRSDVQKLREQGFSDREILDINQITAYYAYVNRIADGLGVPLEEFWKQLEQE